MVVRSEAERRTSVTLVRSAVRPQFGDSWGGVDNQELFAHIDSRVSVRGLVEGEDPIEGLGSWFEAEGRDPLVV